MKNHKRNERPVISSAIKNNFKAENFYTSEIGLMKYKKKSYNLKNFYKEKKNSFMISDDEDKESLPLLSLECIKINDAKKLNNEFKKQLFIDYKKPIYSNILERRINLPKHLDSMDNNLIKHVLNKISLSLDYNEDKDQKENVIILRRYMLNIYEILKQHIYKNYNYLINDPDQDQPESLVNHLKLISNFIPSKKINSKKNKYNFEKNDKQLTIIDNFLENVLNKVQKKILILTEKNLKFKEEDIINLINNETNQLKENLQKSILNDNLIISNEEKLQILNQNDEKNYSKYKKNHKTELNITQIIRTELEGKKLSPIIFRNDEITKITNDKLKHIRSIKLRKETIINKDNKISTFVDKKEKINNSIQFTDYNTDINTESKKNDFDKTSDLSKIILEKKLNISNTNTTTNNIIDTTQTQLTTESNITNNKFYLDKTIEITSKDPITNDLINKNKIQIVDDYVLVTDSSNNESDKSKIKEMNNPVNILFEDENHSQLGKNEMNIKNGDSIINNKLSLFNKNEKDHLIDGKQESLLKNSDQEQIRNESEFVSKIKDENSTKVNYNLIDKFKRIVESNSIKTEGGDKDFKENNNEILIKNENNNRVKLNEANSKEKGKMIKNKNVEKVVKSQIKGKDNKNIDSNKGLKLQDKIKYTNKNGTSKEEINKQKSNKTVKIKEIIDKNENMKTFENKELNNDINTILDKKIKLPNDINMVENNSSNSNRSVNQDNTKTKKDLINLNEILILKEINNKIEDKKDIGYKIEIVIEEKENVDYENIKDENIKKYEKINIKKDDKNSENEKIDEKIKKDEKLVDENNNNDENVDENNKIDENVGYNNDNNKKIEKEDKKDETIYNKNYSKDEIENIIDNNSDLSDKSKELIGKSHRLSMLNRKKTFVNNYSDDDISSLNDEEEITENKKIEIKKQVSIVRNHQINRPRKITISKTDSTPQTITPNTRLSYQRNLKEIIAKSLIDSELPTPRKNTNHHKQTKFYDVIKKFDKNKVYEYSQISYSSIFSDERYYKFNQVNNY